LCTSKFIVKILVGLSAALSSYGIFPGCLILNHQDEFRKTFNLETLDRLNPSPDCIKYYEVIPLN
jgi:hypothetical protein